MLKLTQRQRETLEWIVAYIHTNWRPPTAVEIGDHFGIKCASAFNRIQGLRKKGFLEPGDGTPRSFRPRNLAAASAMKEGTMKQTKGQRDVLAWISTCIRENGQPPTVMEVGAHFGMCGANAYLCLSALEDEGYLERCIGLAPRFQLAPICPHCGGPLLLTCRASCRVSAGVSKCTTS